jgi:2'-5' RNA ligase
VSAAGWRCFVAVPIGERLRRDLAACLEGWTTRDDLAGLRWSERDAWHVTLAFLGDTDPAAVDGIVSELRRVADGHEAFSLTTGGLGGFASSARARVAWYGVADPDRRLRRLAADVGRAVDLEPDRPFAPHVTLARSRGPHVDLRRWIAEATAPDGTLDVERVELIRSHLGRGPAHYETIASAALRSPTS